MVVQNVATPTCEAAQGDVDMASPFHYSALRFLQIMLAIAWSAFAHPFSSSVIDLTTGQVSPAEEQ